MMVSPVRKKLSGEAIHADCHSVHVTSRGIPVSDDSGNSELLGTLIFLSGSDLRSMGTCFNYSRLKGTADLLREGVLIGK